MKILSRYTPLQIAIHIYAWSALVWIIIQMLAGTFSINPIQELEQRTGRHAITLLVLISVAVAVASQSAGPLPSSVGTSPALGATEKHEDSRLQMLPPTYAVVADDDDCLVVDYSDISEAES